MAYEQIIYEVADNIATITLNRPEKLNAFTGIMMNEMLDAFDQADADDNVRAIIVTGDHQWIHIDIERCKKESPFGGPVAHGFLTLSLLPAFKNTDEYAITGFRNVVNYGANKLRFVSPVPAGASVHARSRLIAVDPRPMGTMLTRETEIQVVGQQKPAVVYEALMLFVK